MHNSPLGGDDNGVVVGFMEKVEWDYEIGADMFGTVIYPSPEAVPKHKECGLVEVEVKLRRVVEAEDFTVGNISAHACKKDFKKLQDDPEYQEYMRLREKFDRRWRHYKQLRKLRELQ